MGVIVVFCIIVTSVMSIHLVLSNKKAYVLARPLMFDKMGIRYMKKRHDYSDTIGNGFLLVGSIFCVLYPLIPAYMWIYAIFLLIGYLMLMAQISRIYKKNRSLRIYLVILFSVFVMVGMISASGIFNQMVCKEYAHQFFLDIFQGHIYGILYWFQNVAPMMYLMQAILFIGPLYVLGSQFKYMRLENTFKALHIITLSIKIVLVSAVLLGLAYTGADFLTVVYHVTMQEI